MCTYNRVNWIIKLAMILKHLIRTLWDLWCALVVYVRYTEVCSTSSWYSRNCAINSHINTPKTSASDTNKLQTCGCDP